MIRVSGLRKSYGKQLLFDDVSFSLSPGERVGLVGRNGHGKTTLFKILLDEEHADDGEIFIPRGYVLGHLSQHLNFTQPTILEEVSQSLPMQEGGWYETYRAEEMLAGLGFSLEDMSRPPEHFSGGFQIRLNLAKLLLGEPNLLLLDEPTNYLDVIAVRWLIRFLNEWKNEMMLITHDRDFMDRVTTHTMAIHRAKTKKLEGPTQKLYEQILQEETIHEQTRMNEAKRRSEIQDFIDRFRAQATRARAVQSRVKALEKMEVRTELQEIDSLDFRFKSAPFPGKWVMEVTELEFSFDPQKPPLIADLSFAVGKRDRIAVIGRNGRGKTTLLNLLAGELHATGGRVAVNPNARPAYFGQTNISRLNLDKTVEQEILDAHPEHSRAVARNICGTMMFEGDSALKKVRYLSGGERSRVLLGKILVTPANALLLDEPTNHLDMNSIDALLDAIEIFPGAVIIVTHSELILRTMATRLIVFDRGTVQLFEGGYEDFLRRVGWEEEDSVAGQEKLAARATMPSLESSPGSLSKKELRRQRAEQLKQQGPLKKQMQEIERKITELEQGLGEKNAALVLISQQGDSWKIADLAREIKADQQKIDGLFAELEKVEAALEA